MAGVHDCLFILLSGNLQARFAARKTGTSINFALPANAPILLQIIVHNVQSFGIIKVSTNIENDLIV